MDKLPEQLDADFTESELKDIKPLNHTNKIYKGVKPHVKSGCKKQYIVLNESNHYGWRAWLVTLATAKSLLKIETEIFYIFHCHHRKNKLLLLKIRYPFNVYYECLSINEYKEEIFNEDDDIVIITEDDTCVNDSLILIH
jgi:hypothetical protein